MRSPGARNCTKENQYLGRMQGHINGYITLETQLAGPHTPAIDKVVARYMVTALYISIGHKFAVNSSSLQEKTSTQGQ